mgnify:CR=1 FL=1
MAKEQKTMMETLQGEVRASWNKASSRLAAVLAVLIMVGLPLVFQDYYFNILQVKYWYYCGVVIAAAVIYVIMAVIFWTGTERWLRWSIAERLKKQFIA